MGEVIIDAAKLNVIKACGAASYKTTDYQVIMAQTPADEMKTLKTMLDPDATHKLSTELDKVITASGASVDTAMVALALVAANGLLQMVPAGLGLPTYVFADQYGVLVHHRIHDQTDALGTGEPKH